MSPWKKRIDACSKILLILFKLVFLYTVSWIFTFSVCVYNSKCNPRTAVLHRIGFGAWVDKIDRNVAHLCKAFAFIIVITYPWGRRSKWRPQQRHTKRVSLYLTVVDPLVAGVTQHDRDSICWSRENKNRKWNYDNKKLDLTWGWTKAKTNISNPAGK